MRAGLRRPGRPVLFRRENFQYGFSRKVIADFVEVGHERIERVLVTGYFECLRRNSVDGRSAHHHPAFAQQLAEQMHSIPFRLPEAQVIACPRIRDTHLALNSQNIQPLAPSP